MRLKISLFALTTLACSAIATPALADDLTLIAQRMKNGASSWRAASKRQLASMLT